MSNYVYLLEIVSMFDYQAICSMVEYNIIILAQMPRGCVNILPSQYLVRWVLRSTWIREYVVVVFTLTTNR